MGLRCGVLVSAIVSESSAAPVHGTQFMTLKRSERAYLLAPGISLVMAEVVQAPILAP